MQKFSLLAVGQHPERRQVLRIVKCIESGYQFSDVRVTFEGAGRNSIAEAKSCNLLLIGLATSRASGKRAIVLSSCPCVVWAKTWDAAAARMFRGRPRIEHRVALLLVGKTAEGAPPFPVGTDVVCADQVSEHPFEYRVALDMRRILSDLDSTDQHNGHCPC